MSHFLTKYGPWAIVTGASDGIGRSVALELAKKGLNLVLIARREELLQQLATEIKQFATVELMILAVDLSQAEGNKKIFAAIADLEVGLLAAIAGFGSSGPFIASNLSNEMNMIDVNCKAVLEQTHYIAQRFIKQKRGGIILMSSLVAFQGSPNAANYAATKAYIQTLAEGLHYELKPFGIDVLSAAPGPVATGFRKRAGMRFTYAADPTQVATAIINALGHRLTIRPGFIAKLFGWSLCTAPRPLRVMIMKRIMGKMVGKMG